MREIGVPPTHAIPAAPRGADVRGRRGQQPGRTGHRRAPPDLPHRPARSRSAFARRSHRQRARRLAIPDHRRPDGRVRAHRGRHAGAHDTDAAVDVRLDVVGQPVSLPEIGRFFPEATFPIHPVLTVGVSGTLEALGLDLDVTQSEAGRAQGAITIDTTGPARGITGRLALGRRRPGAHRQVTRRLGRITGNATFDLRFPSATRGFPIDGTFAFRGPRARAYGYEGTDVRATRIDRRPEHPARRVSERLRRNGDDARHDRPGWPWTARADARPGRAGHARRPPRAAGVVAYAGPRDGHHGYLRRGRDHPGPEGGRRARGIDRRRRHARRRDGRPIRTHGARVHVRCGGHRGRPRRAAPRRGAAGAGHDRASPGRTRQRHLRGRGRAARARGTACRGDRDGHRDHDVRGSPARDGLRAHARRRPPRGGGEGPRRGLRARDAHRHRVDDWRTAGHLDGRVTLPDVGAVSIETIGVEGTVTLDSSTLFDVPFAAVTADVVHRRRTGDGQASGGQGRRLHRHGQRRGGPRRGRCLALPLPARRRLARAAGEGRQSAHHGRGDRRGPDHGFAHGPPRVRDGRWRPGGVRRHRGRGLGHRAVRRAPAGLGSRPRRRADLDRRAAGAGRRAAPAGGQRHGGLRRRPRALRHHGHRRRARHRSPRHAGHRGRAPAADARSRAGGP